MRILLAGIFAGVAALIVVGNLAGGITALRHSRNYSSIPFAAGLLGVVACLTAYGIWPSWSIAIPLVADYTIPCFLFTLVVGHNHKSQ
jgi:hypothetical protein